MLLIYMDARGILRIKVKVIAEVSPIPLSNDNLPEAIRAFFNNVTNTHAVRYLYKF